VYTRFSAGDFLSGASSLDALRRLHDLGVRLYAVPRLHAKMLIVPGAFASVGSQNLTAQGRRNREATAVFTGREAVAAIAREADRWIRVAEEITADRIEEMDDAVGPLRARFAEAKADADRIDRRLGQSQAPVRAGADRAPAAPDQDAWDEEPDWEPGEWEGDDEDGDLPEGEEADEGEEDEPGDEEEPADASPAVGEGGGESGSLERLGRRGHAGRARSACEEVVAEVKLVGPLGCRKASLTAPPDASLLDWVVDGERITLRSKHRYTCFLQEE